MYLFAAPRLGTTALALSVGKLWLEKVTGTIVALRSLKGHIQEKTHLKTTHECDCKER